MTWKIYSTITTKYGRKSKCNAPIEDEEGIQLMKTT